MSLLIIRIHVYKYSEYIYICMYVCIQITGYIEIINTMKMDDEHFKKYLNIFFFIDSHIYFVIKAIPFSKTTPKFSSLRDIFNICLIIWENVLFCLNTWEIFIFFIKISKSSCVGHI